MGDAIFFKHALQKTLSEAADAAGAGDVNVSVGSDSYYQNCDGGDKNGEIQERKKYNHLYD